MWKANNLFPKSFPKVDVSVILAAFFVNLPCLNQALNILIFGERGGDFEVKKRKKKNHNIQQIWLRIYHIEWFFRGARDRAWTDTTVTAQDFESAEAPKKSSKKQLFLHSFYRKIIVFLQVKNCVPQRSPLFKKQRKRDKINVSPAWLFVSRGLFFMLKKLILLLIYKQFIDRIEKKC